jgi:S1-C subfamily serine protease
VGLPDIEGVLVHWVEEGSPAERAGIEKGDLIVAADGEPVVRLDDLQSRVEQSDADALVLTLVRGVEEREVTVRLSAVAEV